MAIVQYVTLTKNGSVMDSPCSVSTSDNIGVELAITAENLVGGYERLLKVVLAIKSGNSDIHNWTKNYNHYMKAGTTYTFVSNTTFKLPTGTYTVDYIYASDGVNAGALPLVPNPDRIPQVF